MTVDGSAMTREGVRPRHNRETPSLRIIFRSPSTVPLSSNDSRGVMKLSFLKGDCCNEAVVAGVCVELRDEEDCMRVLTTSNGVTKRMRIMVNTRDDEVSLPVRLPIPPEPLPSPPSLPFRPSFS